MKNGGKPYREVVLRLLNESKPASILDLAYGGGWLARSLGHDAILDGVDAFSSPVGGYRQLFQADINHGVPVGLPIYDAAVICEAMAYMQNPGLLISTVRSHLKPGGIFIVTDPNPSCVAARLNYLIQGFPRSHSCFVRNDRAVPHMPWMNLGLFQYWLLLGLNGFTDIRLHDVDERKPKNIWETPFGYAAKLYCRSRVNKATNEAERDLWRQAGSQQNVFGRRLVISGIAA